MFYQAPASKDRYIRHRWSWWQADQRRTKASDGIIRLQLEFLGVIPIL